MDNDQLRQFLIELCRIHQLPVQVDGDDDDASQRRITWALNLDQRPVFDLGSFYFGCRFDRVPRDGNQQLTWSDVHEIGEQETRHLLDPKVDRGSSLHRGRQIEASKQLLARLRKVSPEFADDLESKRDYSEMKFRLINENDQSIAHAAKSHIAVSYRCGRQVDTSDKGPNTPLPDVFSRTILQHILNGRASPSEGLWIDQICINQQPEGEDERAVAIGDMDMLYSCARQVVAVLHDVELGVDDVAVLHAFCHQIYGTPSYPQDPENYPCIYKRMNPPSNIVQSTAVSKVARRILMSEYFERAWCGHEMRLGGNTVFIVPCRIYKGHSYQYFVTVSPLCLADLTGVLLSTPDLALQLSPSLFFQERRKIMHRARELMYVFPRLRRSLGWPDTKWMDRDNVASRIRGNFLLKAGGNPKARFQESDALYDKTSIVLNSAFSGLRIKKAARNREITQNDCIRRLLCFSLASREALSLCTAGEPLSTRESSTWLQAPHFGEHDLCVGKALISPEQDISVVSTDKGQYVQLDLLFVISGRSCLMEAGSDVGNTRRIPYSLVVNFLPVSKFPGVDLTINAGWEYLKRETLFCLLNSIKESSLRPYATGCTDTGTESVKKVTKWFLDPTNESTSWSTWETDLGCEDRVAMTMFVEDLMMGGLQGWRDRPWLPVWFHGEDGEPVLSFAPKGDEIVLAVPVALQGVEHQSLLRCWVLRKASASKDSNATNCNDWVLLGKTRLFGSKAFNESLSRMAVTKSQQKVWGRTSNELADAHKAARRQLYRHFIARTGWNTIRYGIVPACGLIAMWTIWSRFRPRMKAT